MANHSDGTLVAHDGTRIYHRCWRPEGDPKAAVMLVHGLGEHSGRYEHVAARLNAAGYVVHALDHRGHGRSEGDRVFVRSYDEFMADLILFRCHVQTSHPGLPLIVLGHSMGGNLAVGHVLDHQEGVAGLAVSAPALAVSGALSPVQVRIFKLIARIAPGVRPEGLDATALSRDPSVVDAYLADPLVYSGKMTAGIGAALIGATERFPARYGELTLPLLIMHGTDDRLVEIAGSRALEAGATNAHVTTHYYDGLYHEIFNEPEQDSVLSDLVAWMDDVVSS